MNRRFLIFGPAYLDITLRVAGRIVQDGEPISIDQSIPADNVGWCDGAVVLSSDAGDCMTFQLPVECLEYSAAYHLTEPVLYRLLGAEPVRKVVGEYLVKECGAELGGMGAGYAMAFNGKLRMPVGSDSAGPDAVGRDVLRRLQSLDIASAPVNVPGCSSDVTLLVLSDGGDKLAVGVREALLKWRAGEGDRKLASEAEGFVFCGAPNRLMADVLSWAPDVPVMCAPAMRNVCDEVVPLADLAHGIHYLTMNALEWSYVKDKDRILADVPVVTITEGPNGSRALFGDEELVIPAESHPGPVNTNRAGETYGSTLFKVLLHDDPEFYRSRSVHVDLALRAGQIATTQAARQLDITGFGFPPDDWASQLIEEI